MYDSLNPRLQKNGLQAFALGGGGSPFLSSLVLVLCGFFATSSFALDLDGKALAVAEQVHTGRIVCEMGNVVHITPDAQNRGFFTLQMGKHRFHVSPVPTASGAIRLEDAQQGAMWLQLANKSMLMNSKLGQRMADECQSPAQVAVAEAMKKGPAFNLLEGPAPSVARK
jgi:hypothetical protein